MSMFFPACKKRLREFEHVDKCEGKNDVANCILEKFVETLVMSTGEENKLATKDLLNEKIREDKIASDKADLQVEEKKCLGEAGNEISLGYGRRRHHSQQY